MSFWKLREAVTSDSSHREKGVQLQLWQRRRVAVHEMGHVMSMKHQPIGYSHLNSVMQDDSYESWSLTSVDIANLQYMY